MIIIYRVAVIPRKAKTKYIKVHTKSYINSRFTRPQHHPKRKRKPIMLFCVLITYQQQEQGIIQKGDYTRFYLFVLLLS